VREVRSDVVDTEHVDEQLRELVRPRRDRLGTVREGSVAGPAGQHRVLVAHRPDAGARRRDDRVDPGVVLLEDLDVVPD
jgi:hypothetical protein